METESTSHESHDDYIRAMKEASDESQKQAALLGEAFSNHARALRDAAMDETSQSWEAYSEYIKEAHEKSLEADKLSAEAYSKYTRALIEAWGRSDVQVISTEAYYDYQNDFLEISANARRQIAEAEHKYATRLFQISLEAQKRYREAERGYAVASQRFPGQ